MTPRDDPSREHYGDTIFELFADRSLELDLIESVPPDALARLHEQGVGPTFAVLTACNPHGRAMDCLWNGHPTRVLRAEVASGGRAWAPAVAVSRDRTHREAGVAVSMPKAEARLLAIKLGQSAYFWFDGAVMRIVGAIVDTSDLVDPRAVRGEGRIVLESEYRLSSKVAEQHSIDSALTTVLPEKS